VIANLQRSIEIERCSASKQYQALQQELVNERGRNGNADNKNATPRILQPKLEAEMPTSSQEGLEAQTATVHHSEERIVPEFEQTSEQILAGRCDTAAESSQTVQTKQSPKPPALRVRRLAKNGSVSPLTINPYIHAPSVQVGVEDSENGGDSNQRKRVKRSRRHQYNYT
jgi:hypothetical protein